MLKLNRIKSPLSFGAFAIILSSAVIPTPASSQTQNFCFVWKTNGCLMPAGSIVCGEYRGITTARRDMNEEQLKSLNCFALKSDTIGTVKRPGLSIDAYGQFVVTTPTKVITVWAREDDMTRRGDP